MTDATTMPWGADGLLGLRAGLCARAYKAGRAALATMAALLLATAAASAQAQGAGASSVTAASINDPKAWLARIHSAANTANYHGTLVFSGGGVLSSSRMWHYCVGDQTYEKREALDGRPQRVLRHNDTVHTVWPSSGRVLIERDRPFAARGASPSAVEPRALQQYALQHEGSARVAGREAYVFLLKPRDGLRYAQRLWADKDSGLMLRADVLAPDQSVLESAAFTEIEIGVRPQPELVLREIRRLGREAGLTTTVASLQRTQLEAEGWTIAEPVAGFELAGCVKRPMDQGDRDAQQGAGDAQRDPNNAPHVIQAVFSDGLTHVSLFIEPYQSSLRPRKAAKAQLGATSTVMQRHGRHWITAMGDVPPQTLERLIAALQPRP
jgi:sigma-E factor negative regulatory protein RseB